MDILIFSFTYFRFSRTNTNTLFLLLSFASFTPSFLHFVVGGLPSPSPRWTAQILFLVRWIYVCIRLCTLGMLQRVRAGSHPNGWWWESHSFNCFKWLQVVTLFLLHSQTMSHVYGRRMILSVQKQQHGCIFHIWYYLENYFWIIIVLRGRRRKIKEEVKMNVIDHTTCIVRYFLNQAYHTCFTT